jgi:hypothetical protein
MYYLAELYALKMAAYMNSLYLPYTRELERTIFETSRDYNEKLQVIIQQLENESSYGQNKDIVQIWSIKTLDEIDLNTKPKHNKPIY